MSGLNPDMTPEGVRDRLLRDGMSGLPPHKRPGHHAPKEPTAREQCAVRGAEVLRSPPSEDIPQT
jgi:hypothetical protein